MARFLTLSERKNARVDAICGALPEFERELQSYARLLGRRFILFGSTITDRLHYDSDIDFLADFPRNKVGDTLDFANDPGSRFDLPVDARVIA